MAFNSSITFPRLNLLSDCWLRISSSSFRTCDFLSLPESPFVKLIFSLTALYRKWRVSDPRGKGRERQSSDHDGGGKG